MPEIISRSRWGAKYAPGPYRRRVGRLERWLHHTVTVAPDMVPPFSDDYAAVRSVERITEERFKWGMAYSFLITPSGLVFEGHPIDRVGAHTQGHNTAGAGIAFVGNYERDAPSPEALRALDWLLHEGVRRGWWAYPTLSGGHRDTKATACPGRRLYALIGAVNAGVYHEVLEGPGGGFPSTGGGGGGSDPDSPPTGLLVDGQWGRRTTRDLQHALGTPVDGAVSSQSAHWAASNPGLTTGWRWVRRARGSKVIKALQKRIGMPWWQRDGKIGPVTIKALQRWLGTPIDGVISEKSQAVTRLQEWLNEGKV